jgi:hypothetical protein
MSRYVDRASAGVIAPELLSAKFVLISVVIAARVRGVCAAEKEMQLSKSKKESKILISALT